MRGQIDLIYIDPPFNTGENFNFPNEVTIGDKTFEKEMPMSERLAYTDTWDRGIDSFLDMLYPRLQLMRRLRNQQVFDFVITEVRKKLMKFIQNTKSNEVIEADWTKLSNYKNQKIRMECTIATKKCLYPYVDFPPRGGFERKFTENILENDSSVESYVKLNQYVHQFSIPYINTMGHLVPYYPDFLVLLPQNIFEEMEGSGLQSLIDKCEANLAVLKMRRE